MYTVGLMLIGLTHKNVPAKFSSYFRQILTDFKKEFYWYTLRKKCNNIRLLRITPHFNGICVVMVHNITFFCYAQQQNASRVF